MSTPPPPFETPSNWATWWRETSGRVGTPYDLRASDAERSVVADLLSRHYAEGRLDDDELKERIALAMSAKMRSELGRLTADLPYLETPGTLPLPRRHHHRLFAAVILIFLVLWSASWALAAPHVSVLFAVVVGLLAWRHFSARTWRGWDARSCRSCPPYR